MEYLSTDKYIVLDSRTIMMDAQDVPLIIPIMYENECQGYIKVIFEVDKSTNVIDGVIGTKGNDDLYIIRCINFGYENLGYTELINIGKLNGMDIYIRICSGFIDNISHLREVTYVIFMNK